jgi:hypothetical protein
MHRLMLSLSVWFGVAGASQTSLAQDFAPRGPNVAYQTGNFLIDRPTVSPYLNLARDPTGVLPNYFTLVRPELEARDRAARQERELQRLRSQLTGLQSEVRQAQESGRLSTGHPTRFMTYFHFYPGLAPRR